MNPKTYKGGSQSEPLGVHFTSSELSETKRKVLKYLSEPYFYMPSKIADKIGISKSKTYRHIKDLRRMGYLEQRGYRVHKRGVALKPPLKNFGIRLHNEHYDLKIAFAKPKYLQMIDRGEVQKTIKGNTVIFYRHKVEVYSNTDFIGDTAGEARTKALQFWPNFIAHIEVDYGIVLQGHNQSQIRRVRAHYEDMNNPFAKTWIEEDQHIKFNGIKGKDGLYWLIVDRSGGLYNLETIHPRKSHEDMQDVVGPVMNAYRDNDCYLPDQTTDLINKTLKNIKEISKHNKDTAAGLNALVQLLSLKTPDKTPIAKTLNNKPPYII